MGKNEQAKLLGILALFIFWLFTALNAGIGFVFLIVFIGLAISAEH